jgi:hypothetical protein
VSNRERRHEMRLVHVITTAALLALAGPAAAQASPIPGNYVDDFDLMNESEDVTIGSASAEPDLEPAPRALDHPDAAETGTTRSQQRSLDEIWAARA